MDNANGLWAKELPDTIWAISMTVHSGIKDTPFNLTFGTNAVILVEIGINTLLIAHLNSWENESVLKTNLNLFERQKKKSA